jgi:hypothetical protein
MSGSPMMPTPRNRLRATSAAFGTAVSTKIIAKLFIGLSLAATSVYSFEHRSDGPPTVA